MPLKVRNNEKHFCRCKPIKYFLLSLCDTDGRETGQDRPTTTAKKITNCLDYSRYFTLLLLQRFAKRKQKMIRGNNFHKTQQCEKEKIIKGRKRGLEGKVILKRRKCQTRERKIFYSIVSKKFYLPFVISLLFLQLFLSFVALSWSIFCVEVKCPLLISFNGRISGKGALNINLFGEGRNLSYLNFVISWPGLKFHSIHSTTLRAGDSSIHLNVNKFILITNQLLFKHRAVFKRFVSKVFEGKTTESIWDKLLQIIDSFPVLVDTITLLSIIRGSSYTKQLIKSQ